MITMSTSVSAAAAFSPEIFTVVGGGSGDGNNCPAETDDIGDGCLATHAITSSFGVALDNSGNLYIAETYDAAFSGIRKVNASTGIITMVVGGSYGYSGDGGPATSAELAEPVAVALDAAGDIYIADMENLRVRKVTASTGIITTVAGNGTAGPAGDGGAATSAELNYPWGVTVDASGNIYIADTSNNRIRKVTASTGVISTVAGNGTAGYSGDGGQATKAEIAFPYGVAVDLSGNIYIADSGNMRIRKVSASTGIISTVVGDGTQGYSGDGGLATNAEICLPWGVTVDAAGDIYFSDPDADDVRKVNAATGIINTVAGASTGCWGTGGFAGDGGLATSAKLYQPSGLALDTANDIYIADTENYRVRAVGHQ